MSTVSEIWSAIQELSPQQRVELDSLMHPDWDLPLPDSATPPNVREKLAAAQQGKFLPGDRSNISRILTGLK